MSKDKEQVKVYLDHKHRQMLDNLTVLSSSQSEAVAKAIEFYYEQKLGDDAAELDSLLNKLKDKLK